MVMKPSRSGRPRDRGLRALDLVEEAVHLLRRAPPDILLSYYLGSLPFVAALLFFWADMSQAADARRHCAGASLALACLYIWMKCWQAVYASKLRARLAGDASPTWTLSRAGRLVAAQAIVQPLAFVALPLSLIAIIPFGWVYAFFQSLSLTGDGEYGGTRSALRRAARQATFWKGQNHVLILILAAFGAVVFLNLCALMGQLPQLARMFSGSENVFARSGGHLFNSTFFAIAGGLAYLALNPLIKAAYVLRCFYGESLATGADLAADLARVARPARAAAAAIFLLLAAAISLPAAPEPEPAEAAVDGARLDRSIGEVIQGREYSWRFPRERLPPEVTVEPQGWLGRFGNDVLDTLQGWGRSVREGWRNLVAWIRDWMDRQQPRRSPPGTPSWNWDIYSTQTLIVVLLTVVACVLAIVLLRMWKERRRVTVATAVPVVSASPDLTQEDIPADLLPSDEWMAMARDLMAKGEPRLALRAVYLSTLAFLAQREILTLAKFKSNRDYEREVGRRAHSRPELITAFSQNKEGFESAWYGMHPVDDAAVREFIANHERIQSHAA